jgi:hypothetical protein
MSILKTGTGERFIYYLKFKIIQMKTINIQQVKTYYPVRLFCITAVFLSIAVMGLGQVSEYNFATGNVNGRNHVGGLIGSAADKEGVISNSYARGSVTGEAQIGGIAGSNSGTIDRTYSTGKVTGNSSTGGMAGSGNGTVTASYWDVQTSAKTISSGGTGRNTDPMTWPYASDTYSGWDFTSVWKADVSPFQNGGYPLLSASALFQVSVQVYPPGAGTVTGEGYFLSGQSAQLGITADNRYVFKGWMKNSTVLSTGPQYSLKVAGQTSLIARFESKITSIRNDHLVHTQKLKIYPNPVKDILWVDFSSVKEEVTMVAVDNLAGQRVKMIDTGQAALKHISIEVSGLKPGVYIIHALQTNGYCSERFVKY